MIWPLRYGGDTRDRLCGLSALRIHNTNRSKSYMWTLSATNTQYEPVKVSCVDPELYEYTTRTGKSLIADPEFFEYTTRTCQSLMCGP